MKKKRYYLLCTFFCLLLIYAYHVRGAYITQHKWKQTSENGLIGGGFISFGNNSGYTYQWPIIKRGEEYCGIILLCFDKRMIVFSLQDNSVGFYMYI